MNNLEWLNQVAILKTLPINHPDNCSFLDDRKEYDIYVSKFDGSFITMKGLETDNTISFLAEHEVVDNLTHGLGFSPKENKWYGWSHRAIMAFGIGSTCKYGDCHYHPKDEDDFIKCECDFLKDEYTERIHAVKSSLNGERGITLITTYNNKVPNPELKGRINSTFIAYPHKFGRGEWIAETIEDAKQMAIDFREGVN